MSGRSEIRTVCTVCMDPIHDGDTVYQMDGALFCPACVKGSLTVYRPQPPTIPDSLIIENTSEHIRTIVFRHAKKQE